ncbi:MAG: hypothetical protein OXN85_07470 [Gemmatimonadetes bacterium]|nr:hypothetical protein [Candidatus Palauibacter australiensis]
MSRLDGSNRDLQIKSADRDQRREDFGVRTQLAQAQEFFDLDRQSVMSYVNPLTVPHAQCIDVLSCQIRAAYDAESAATPDEIQNLRSSEFENGGPEETDGAIIPGRAAKARHKEGSD